MWSFILIYTILLTETENEAGERKIGGKSLSAPQKIAELVERFDRYQENYDPFFKALGCIPIWATTSSAATGRELQLFRRSC